MNNSSGEGKMRDIDATGGFDLTALMEMPIDSAARANNVWLPAGRRAPKRDKRPALSAVEREELSKSREKAAREKDAAFHELARYYASTSLPLERIAANLGMNELSCSKLMADLGWRP